MWKMPLELVVITSYSIHYTKLYDDIIIIAGKGHEDYQEINGVKHHFDDREVINEFFEMI